MADNVNVGVCAMNNKQTVEPPSGKNISVFNKKQTYLEKEQENGKEKKKHKNNICKSNTVEKDTSINGKKDVSTNKNSTIPVTLNDLIINSGENEVLKREELMKKFVLNVFENNSVLFLYCKYVLLVYGKELIEEKNIDLLNFEVIKGGITNILVKFCDVTNKNKFLIRLYGPKTSEIINREREKKIASILGETNISKKIYTFFPNGRIEEYMEGYALTGEDIKNEQYQKKIAKKLKMLHDINISDDTFENLKNLQYIHDDSDQRNEVHTDKRTKNIKERKPGRNNKKEKKVIRSSFLWSIIWKYFRLLHSEKKSVHSFHSKLNILNLIDFQKLELTIKNVENMCSAKKSPVVLCHCDLLSSNILRKNNGEIIFIDFEYSCPVERAFDIANHFNEYAGFSCSWNLLPTKAEEYNFVKHYLQTDNTHLLNSLVNEIQPFYLASHIYWGLWALLQAMHSCIDFDFVGYAMKRLTALYLPIFTEKVDINEAI